MLETEVSRPPTTVLPLDNRSWFEEVFSGIEHANLDYRVVGSTAIAAYLGEHANVRMRDIDVICFTRNAATVRMLQAEFDRKHTQLAHPITLPKLLVNIGRDNNGYCVNYNDLREPINEKVMQPVQLPFAETTITTIPPETLLHLYIARGGSLKPKDMPKLRKLAGFCANHPTKGLVHSDFEVFHRFAARMRSDYPWQTSLYRFLAQVDYVSGGKISKNHLVAKAIRHFSS